VLRPAAAPHRLLRISPRPSPYAGVARTIRIRCAMIGRGRVLAAASEHRWSFDPNEDAWAPRKASLAPGYWRVACQDARSTTRFPEVPDECFRSRSSGRGRRSKGGLHRLFAADTSSQKKRRPVDRRAPHGVRRASAPNRLPAKTPAQPWPIPPPFLISQVRSLGRPWPFDRLRPRARARQFGSRAGGATLRRVRSGAWYDHLAYRLTIGAAMRGFGHCLSGRHSGVAVRRLARSGRGRHHMINPADSAQASARDRQRECACSTRRRA
jgi:hypothetical protein